MAKPLLYNERMNLLPIKAARLQSKQNTAERSPMNTPVLLTYNLNGDRAKTIGELAAGLGISVREVSPEAYGQSLNCLLGMAAPGEAARADEGFEEEMLVIAGFPSALINRFLDAFRQQGIPSVKLKALLTPTNGMWTSTALHTELRKESAAMPLLRATTQAKKAEEAK